MSSHAPHFKCCWNFAKIFNTFLRIIPVCQRLDVRMYILKNSDIHCQTVPKDRCMIFHESPIFSWSSSTTDIIIKNISICQFGKWKIVTLLFLICILNHGDINAFKMTGFITFLANYLLIHLVSFSIESYFRGCLALQQTHFCFLLSIQLHYITQPPMQLRMAVLLSSSPDYNRPL